MTVYPFIRSYEWYLLPPEERSRIMAEHGRSGARFPDVKGSTLSAFGMSDYEWILAFEADSLDRIEAVLHGQRYTEARLHVREDTPFYTGHRVSVRDWVGRPAAAGGLGEGREGPARSCLPDARPRLRPDTDPDTC